ncbi:MAG: glucokinase, partial [Gammaproteobacteria bacterium]|nr:glucokinase [Gammaproteobacteria bacterium]
MDQTTTILAADIGGTKTLLSLNEIHQFPEYQTIKKQRYESAAYNSFEELVLEFLRGEKSPSIACIAVAGPVEESCAKVTNLPWTLQSKELANTLNLAQLSLVNDFEAVGLCIPELQETDLITLQEGQAVEKGVKAVIGAGTGLGHATLVYTENTYRVLPSEAGHCDFAPGSPIEERLLNFLRQELGHVSWERVVSGPGLENIYRFLLSDLGATSSAEISDALSKGEGAAAIALAAQNKVDTIAQQSLRLFLDLYAAQAGNHALNTLCFGGLYLAGGIAPKLIQELQQSQFMEKFSDKGRMKSLLQRIPVKVIVNPEAGLIGAIVGARKIAQ